MEYSHFAAPSIMPLIHPSEDDISMGAVDYLSEDPLGNSTKAHPEDFSILNSTLVSKISGVMRNVVPQLVEHVMSGPVPVSYTSTPPTVEQADLPGYNPGYVPESSVHIQVDYVPIIPVQVINLAIVHCTDFYM
jgi:hypothetical protein